MLELGPSNWESPRVGSEGSAAGFGPPPEGTPNGRSDPARRSALRVLGVYRVRMGRVNITMPEELHQAAKRAGLNVSQLAQQAVAAELRRSAKLAELDGYLAELEAELGPTSEEERAVARAWADNVFGPVERRESP